MLNDPGRQPDGGNGSYVTRGEFNQFGRRMDDSLAVIRTDLRAIANAVGVGDARAAAGVWFGPRLVTLFKIVLPALATGAVGYAIAYLFGH